MNILMFVALVIRKLKAEESPFLLKKGLKPLSDFWRRQSSPFGFWRVLVGQEEKKV